MNNLKKNYEVIAIGNIQMRVLHNIQTEKRLAKNYKAIEKIWDASVQEKAGKLFNGTLLNFISVDKNGETIDIASHFIEYKHFIAQRKDPCLELGIKPIGVSGIIILKDKGNEYVIFAKRDNNVTEYAGLFELVPSGSIDKECVDANGIIDYSSKMLSEFIEETGLCKEHVKEISGFAFILDTDHNVYDICCKILLELKKEIVEQRFCSKEYNEPVFVAMNDLDSFIEANVDLIVPTSMALIEAYRCSVENNKKSYKK